MDYIKNPYNKEDITKHIDLVKESCNKFMTSFPLLIQRSETLNPFFEKQYYSEYLRFCRKQNVSLDSYSAKDRFLALSTEVNNRFQCLSEEEQKNISGKYKWEENYINSFYKGDLLTWLSYSHLTRSSKVSEELNHLDYKYLENTDEDLALLLTTVYNDEIQNKKEKHTLKGFSLNEKPFKFDPNELIEVHNKYEPRTFMNSDALVRVFDKYGSAEVARIDSQEYEKLLIIRNKLNNMYGEELDNMTPDERKSAFESIKQDNHDIGTKNPRL